MKWKILLFVLAGLLYTGTVRAYDSGCGNPGDNADECDGVGANPINPYRASLNRSVTDLQTFGAAPIEFTRHYNSRTRNYTRARWELGTQYTWQHNWQFEMRESGTADFGFPRLIVRYPEGREQYFQATDASGSVRVPAAHWGDRVYPNGAGKFVLRTPEGREYEFRKVTVPGGYQYLLDQVRNGTGWKWTLTYQQYADGLWRLYRVTNNYGRYLQLARAAAANGYWHITSVSANDGRSVTFHYSNWAPTSETVLTSIVYPGGEQATYTWCGADSLTSGPPLIASASDPMYSGSGSRMRYVYNYTAEYFGGSPSGIVNGTILEERSLVTDKLIVSLPLGSGAHPQILEGNGTEITRKYEKGRLKELIDGEGRVTTYERSAGGVGYLTGITTHDGAKTQFTRDFAGRVLTKTDDLGGVRSFTYNAAGFLLIEEDELGRKTKHTRNASNFLTRTDHPDGTYETFTYTGTGLVKTHRLRNGATETWSYDGWGNVVAHTDAVGATAQYGYFLSGLRSSETDRRGFVTTFQYNWRGQVTLITHPDGSYREFTYDTFGNKTSERNELGNVWTFTHTEFNQLASITDPLGRTTSYEYGQTPGCGTCGYLPTLTRTTLPSGKKVENTYDDSGKLLTSTVGAGTPDAATTEYVYGDNGRVSHEIDPLGHVTVIDYDSLGRKTAVTDPLGHTTNWTYDAVGNVLVTTRADGTSSSSTYDAMDRPLTSTDALGQMTKYTYHPDGALASLTDAKGNAYSFTVDVLSRRTRMTYPGGSYEEWTYDPESNRTQYRTRSGVTMTCAFDNRNRETSCDWSDGTPDVARKYDAAGHLLSVSNSVATSDFGYNAADQTMFEKIQITGLPAPLLVGYAYDADGNRTKLVYPDGGEVTLAYTGRNQVASIDDTLTGSPSARAQFMYDAADNRTSRTLKNGITSTYGYDGAGRLTSLSHGTGGSVDAFTYTYDIVNRRTGETRVSGRTRSYAYYADDQLKQVVDPAGTWLFQYDAVGNRVTVSAPSGGGGYTTNPLNQYTSAPSTPALAYDANGNLASAGGWTYTHDGDSRLTSASGPGGVQATLDRDAFRRNVKRTENGTVTYLVYDGWNLIAEYDGQGNTTAQYVHGPRTDEILVRIGGSLPTYLLEDGLGSAIAVTSSAGLVLERVFYDDAFGTPRFVDTGGNPLPGTTSVAQNRFLFTGREWLASIGLYDYRNRVYSPTLGRFIEADPIRFAAGDVNIYRYIGNRVANGTDPFGLEDCDEKEEKRRERELRDIVDDWPGKPRDPNRPSIELVPGDKPEQAGGISGGLTGTIPF